MTDTVRIGRIAGVKVGLHWSLLLVGGLLVEQLAGRRFRAHAPGYSDAAYLVAAAVTAIAFFGCVLAHELGHAVVARRQGIGVDGITLWFLGGVTRLVSEPATPMAELAVAGVGPLTSFALGLAATGAGIVARGGGISPLLADALTWLGVINLVIAVFNALPGAPLDGGCVLHAFVWNRHGDEGRATRVASRAGEILGTSSSPSDCSSSPSSRRAEPDSGSPSSGGSFAPPPGQPKVKVTTVRGARCTSQLPEAVRAGGAVGVSRARLDVATALRTLVDGPGSARPKVDSVRPSFHATTVQTVPCWKAMTRAPSGAPVTPCRIDPGRT